MNYLSIFKLYFNDCETLRKINIKENDFYLVNKTKSFYYSLKKIILMNMKKIHLLSLQKLFIFMILII